MKYAAFIAALLIAAPAAAQEIPSLLGTWKGASDGLGKQDGWVTGPVTLVVTEQRGRSFKARITYASPKGGEQNEDLVGTLAPDGASIYLAGDDGIHIAALKGGILDACYLEPGDNDGLAVCSRLQKQP
ncbi:hypothetical protein [Aquabacter spiritensis]|uniref:TIGR03067 domain-containing protein n=1 Tax=Aquabacter spiritensis TaxID=933073 RepID=A0A4R3LU96_9HYPH|nr:hypothetical protein [Aquabacter spiritensis]TCT03179.1 hypothetical protein EDC64_11042 [Aquabacter spiritensis]